MQITKIRQEKATMRSIVFCLAMLCISAFALELGANCAVVQPEKPTAVEKTAVERFCELYKSVTGKTPTVQTQAPSGAAVYIGDTAAARELGYIAKDLKREETILHVKGNRIVITGGPQGGALYAVYDFFRKFADCEWFDFWTARIPQANSIKLQDFTQRRVPSFDYRKIYVVMTGAKSIQKGLGPALKMSEWKSGMVMGPPAPVHTFYFYSRYWPKKNLKLFTMNEKGKRMLPRGTIGPNFCLTNPECSELVEKQLRKWIEQEKASAAKNGYPAPYIYHIGENDITKYFCLCPECRAVADKCGHSGLMLQFINGIAKRIGPDYPEIIIGTAAYAFTREPPKIPIPIEPNVSILYCPKDTEFYRPWMESRAGDNKKCLLEWSKLCDKMCIWDYWVFYWDRYPAPYTMLDHLAKDLRDYKAIGVKYMQAESEAWESSNFFSLRQWLGYMMMFDLDEDEAALTKRFMDGFFGKASPMIQEYLNLLVRRQKEMPPDLQFAVFSAKHDGDRPYLDAAFFKEADAIFDKAEKACANDKTALLNVRRERMIVDEAMLNLWYKQNVKGDFNKVLARLKAEWLEHIDFRVTNDARAEKLAKLDSKLSRLSNFATIEKQKKAPLQSMVIPRSNDWSKCALVSKWFETPGYPSNAKLTLEARREGNMLLFRAKDSGINHKLKATSQIWDGDDWEIMLTSQPDKKEFFQVLVNSEGKYLTYHTGADNRAEAMEDKEIKVSSKLEGKEWCVEVTVPLKAIPGQGGDVLYGNFFRSANDAKNAQSWNPVFDNLFRERSAFGKITLEQ